MLMRLLTFRRVLRRRRIMPLKGLCKPPAQPVVMIYSSSAVTAVFVRSFAQKGAVSSGTKRFGV